jgi:hypothetical protein
VTMRPIHGAVALSGDTHGKIDEVPVTVVEIGDQKIPLGLVSELPVGLVTMLPDPYGEMATAGYAFLSTLSPPSPDDRKCDFLLLGTSGDNEGISVDTRPVNDAVLTTEGIHICKFTCQWILVDVFFSHLYRNYQ